MNIEQIANDNKDRFKSKEGFARTNELLKIAKEKKLNEDDTNNPIDAFEELGVEICFKTNKK